MKGAVASKIPKPVHCSYNPNSVKRNDMKSVYKLVLQ